MKICGIRFKSVGKIYYFDPCDIELAVGDSVIVETARGVELGQVAIAQRDIEPDPQREIKPIIRKATAEDIAKFEENKIKAEQALKKCAARVAYHKLDMKLVDCEYTFDNSKVLFYFTSDGRVDFRELVKDLASLFRTRIELRQIGVRDESKMKGGLGICGQPFCCARYMGEFHPVSIKMAKDQGLSLSPSKISGTCGRLMCCLKHEQDAYEQLLKITPKVGAIVKTPNGKGNVTDVNLLTGELKVKIGKEGEQTIKPFNRDEITLIKDATIKLDEAEKQLAKELEE